MQNTHNPNETSAVAPDQSEPHALLERFDPFDSAVQQCPFPYYRAMRSTCPAFHLDGTDLYFVTRRDLVVRIVRDTATFSSRFGQTAELPPVELAQRIADIREHAWAPVPTITNEDPPLHDRYRELVAPFYAPAHIATYEPRIRDICDELIDAWPADGDVEFLEQFAGPLPLLVTIDLLGLDPTRIDDYARWSAHATAAIGSRLEPHQWEETQGSVVEMQQFFAAEIDRRTALGVDDLFTRVGNAQIPDDHGESHPIEMGAALSMLQQVFVGGIETTTKLLTEALVLLTRRPDIYKALRGDPSRIPTVVEEVLRLATPAQGLYRLVTRDVELDGVHIPAGSRVLALYAEANRDPAHFTDPDAFDPERANAGSHLSFGRGIHFCLGASLARLEARVALEVLTRRIEQWTFVEGNTYEYEPSFILRGLKSLRLAFRPAIDHERVPHT
jgi:cytochrome P450